MSRQEAGERALASMSPVLKDKVVCQLPLKPFNMVGLDRLLTLFDSEVLPGVWTSCPPPPP